MEQSQNTTPSTLSDESPALLHKLMMVDMDVAKMYAKAIYSVIEEICPKKTFKSSYTLKK
jgi:hypothetical protein